MIHVEPKELPVKKVHAYLLGGVGPRPVALVSTLSADGVPNLSPFSFFNAFGANPPIVGFSPSRRVRDGSLKDTYRNLVATQECVVQAVTYAMIRQVSLASTEYPSDVNEFIKCGLTPVPSDLVKPARVKESPFQMECRLWKMVPLGDERGSGNLALCEVVKFHIAEDLFVDGVIHPDRIDLVGRQSADFYARASGPAVFEAAKPGRTRGIGFDKLPGFVLSSRVLSANNLAQLAGVEEIPGVEQVQAEVDRLEVKDAAPEMFYRFARQKNYQEMLAVAVTLQRQRHPRGELFIECAARQALACNDVAFAWRALVFLGSLKSSSEQVRSG